MSAQELITERLDLWTGAVTKKSSSGRGNNGKVELTGIKKLRELILELAVRGSLTEQRFDESDASKIVANLYKEQKQLVATGQIKKPKPLKPINEREKPFPLPRGWQWVRLGQTMEMYNGRAFKSSEWSTSGLPIVRIQNLNDPKAPTNYFSGPVDDRHSIDNGTFLISWSGTPGTSFGAFIWNRGPAALNQHINKCVFFGDFLSPKFMQLAVNGQMKSFIQSAQGGVGLKHVTKGVLTNALIALPPQEEQYRIVQKVNELMILCDRLEQQTSDQLEAHETLVDTLLDSLLKPDESALTQPESAMGLADNWARLAAHFDTLFTTEQSIDKLKQTILQVATAGRLVPFQVAPVLLKNILSFGPRNGFSPKESAYGTGYRVLKLGATTKGRLDLLESKNVDIDDLVQSHLWLKKGDILIQRGNAANHVGCNLLLEENYPRYIYPDLMMKIRVNEKKAIPSFVALYLSAPRSRRFMWERMTGTSGTMPKISKKVVEEIPVTLPNLETQQAVVQKVDELLALCSQLKERLNQAGETRYQLAESLVEKAIS